MTNTTQSIVRKSLTLAATFTDKPSDEHRKRLKAAGAEFKNGQWVRHYGDGAAMDAESAVRMFEGK